MRLELPDGSPPPRAIVLAVVLSGAACVPPAFPDPGTVSFETAPVEVVTDEARHPLTVELARTWEQQAVGLRSRETLPDDAGMLFLFEEEQGASTGFWMWETRIPLDVAYLDAEGVILRIVSLEPCPSADRNACPLDRAGRAYRGALEVNRGWFAARGVAAGDRVAFEGLGRN